MIVNAKADLHFATRPYGQCSHCLVTDTTHNSAFGVEFGFSVASNIYEIADNTTACYMTEDVTCSGGGMSTRIDQVTSLFISIASISITIPLADTVLGPRRA